MSNEKYSCIIEKLTTLNEYIEELSKEKRSCKENLKIIDMRMAEKLDQRRILEEELNRL